MLLNTVSQKSLTVGDNRAPNGSPDQYGYDEFKAKKQSEQQ